MRRIIAAVGGRPRVTFGGRPADEAASGLWGDPQRPASSQSEDWEPYDWDEDELEDGYAALAEDDDFRMEPSSVRATFAITATELDTPLSREQVELITSDAEAALRILFGSVTLVERSGDFDRPVARVVLDLADPQDVPGMPAGMPISMMLGGVGAGVVTGIGKVTAAVTV